MTGVSVVIPHYGDPSGTEALVEALVAEHTEHELEIIVVDDASPTPFPDDPRTRVVRRERNGGFGSAVNSGASAATLDWLMILNSDLTPPEHFIDAMVARSLPPQPAITGPRLVNEAGEDQHSGRRFPTISHQVVEWLIPLAGFRSRLSLQRGVGYDTRCGSGRDTTVDWVVGAAMVVPRALFGDLGGFDERFYMNCEEVDFQRHANRRGIRSIQLGSVTIVHSGGGSSTDQATRRRWVVTARHVYARKWGGLRRLQLALSLATTVNLLWNGIRSVAGRSVRPLAVAREEFGLIWGPLNDPR